MPTVGRAYLCLNVFKLILLAVCQGMSAEKRGQCCFLRSIIIEMYYAGIIILHFKPIYNEGQTIVF